MTDRVTLDFAEPVRATERMVHAWQRASHSRRAWFGVALAVIVAAHAGLLALLLWHDDALPPQQVTETPVEVVAEMPPPEQPKPEQPKPQQPKPQPATPQPPEKPATSAPRAQNDETIERDADDSESRAPKAAETPPRPAPSPTKQEARLDPKPDAAKTAAAEPPPKPADVSDSTKEAASDVKAEKAESAAPPDDPSEAEALDKAPPEPPRRPASLAVAPTVPKPPMPPRKPAKLASAKLAMAEPRAPSRTAIEQLAGSSDLPDYVFAKPQRKPSKYKGGSEDNRYLAVVYAMVTQNHEAIPLPDGDWHVAVAFQVDGHGDLIGIALTQSSGYREVDAAAVDAVRRAAPFPPPPSGGVTGLIARLSSAAARAAMARAARGETPDDTPGSMARGR